MNSPLEFDRQRRENIRPIDYVTYRGREGMVAWLLHRITGVGVLLFLLAHIIDTSLIGWGPNAYNKAIALYRETGFRIGEIILFGMVLFHALNGVRICVMDFWPRTTLIQKKLFYWVVTVFVVLYIPIIAIMVRWMTR
jgi:succinate dehydrogenase / fumarate reductase, cytochrome b subunit